MISLMSFYFRDDYDYREKDTLEDVVSSLNRNIEFLKKCGWKKENIIVKTNFNFQHQDATHLDFVYHGLTNLFLTKIVAAYEVSLEYPNEVIWYHDHDTYQIRRFVDEEIQKILKSDINMCTWWKGNPKPQGASIFYKPENKSLKILWKELKNINTKESSFWPTPQFQFCDETFMLRSYDSGLINASFDLPFEYNTSITPYSSDKRFSENPYCIHGDIRKKFDKRVFNEYISKMNF